MKQSQNKVHEKFEQVEIWTKLIKEMLALSSIYREKKRFTLSTDSSKSDEKTIIS